MDDVEHGGLAAELNAPDEPEVEKLSLPKFGTWNAPDDDTEDTMFGYWFTEALCDEKGP
jgi:hypothetical protein